MWLYRDRLLPDHHPHTIECNRIVKLLSRGAGPEGNRPWRVHVFDIENDAQAVSYGLVDGHVIICITTVLFISRPF